MVSSSASGTAIHKPIMPQMIGSTSSAAVIKTRVRSTEILADILPSDKAVNIAEAKILKPQNRKLMGKIQNPCLAMS